jgi:hypothetical protein
MKRIRDRIRELRRDLPAIRQIAGQIADLVHPHRIFG